MGSSGGAVSEALRKEGNRLYKMVADDQEGTNTSSLCLFERRIRATCADEIYLQALQQSFTWEDRASCCKNLGILNLLRSKLQLQHALQISKHSSNQSFNGDLDLCKEYLLRGVCFLLQAKKHGTRAGKTKDWIAHLEGSIDEAVDWAIVESSNCDLSVERALFILTGEGVGEGSFNGDLEVYREEAREMVVGMVEEKLKMLQAYLQQVKEAEEEEEARRQLVMMRNRRRAAAAVQVEQVSIRFTSLNVSPAPSFYTPSSLTLLQQYYQFF